MRCERARRLAAGAWGRGPLPSRLERHLRACPACRHEAALLARLLDDLRDEPIPDPGEGYWDAFAGRVRSRIDRSPGTSPVPAPFLGSLRSGAVWAAAAAVLVVAGATLLWRARWQDWSGAAGEADLARIEAQLDEALGGATAEDSDALEALTDLLPAAEPGEGPDGLEEAAEPLLEDDEALEAAGELAAALSSEGFPEWGRMDRLVETIGREEAARLMEGLAPEGSGPEPGGEGAAG
jgi:hypothetical protein